MRASKFSKISDRHTLFNEAASFHARLMRMKPSNDNGQIRGDLNAISALAKTAEKLGVISRFNYSARGVVFLQEEDAIMRGDRPLKPVEAQSVVGYVKNQCKRGL